MLVLSFLLTEFQTQDENDCSYFVDVSIWTWCLAETWCRVALMWLCSYYVTFSGGIKGDKAAKPATGVRVCIWVFISLKPLDIFLLCLLPTNPDVSNETSGHLQSQKQVFSAKMWSFPNPNQVFPFCFLRWKKSFDTWSHSLCLGTRFIQ